MLNLLFIYFSLSIFAKFLMPFLKAQVSFPLNFASILSAIRGIKWTFFRLSSAQVKMSEILYVNLETTSQFLSKFCIPLQFHERLFLCTFLAQTIYTLLKRSTLKWKFLRLSSARVKIRQIPHVNFEMTSQFLFKFCIIFHCHFI